MQSRQIAFAIHRFHQDTSREIWSRYSTNRHDSAVALAVVRGILRRAELPAELQEHLGKLIDSYEAVETGR
jgi:hypothetical protein